MKVVHVNNADIGHGGAALAAFRLHESLGAVGVESRMRVAMKASDETAIDFLPQLPRFQRFGGAVMRRVGLNDLVGLKAYQLLDLPDVAGADVLHFHLLEGNFFSYPALVRISAAKPVVMTLHDMWPLTGHCSYSYECERWRTGCGRCPHLDVYPEVKRDATGLEWRLKNAVYKRSLVRVVAPSTWLAGLASEGVLGRFPVSVVRYGLDVSAFRSRPRLACRAALGLPTDAIVIAAVAASFEDPRKGADLLIESLRRLSDATKAQSVVAIMGFGASPMVRAIEAAGLRVVDLEYVRSESIKVTFYSASDFFLLPTRADNSPLVVLEASACGVPTIAFDVGGVSDTVRNDDTGLLVPPNEVAAFAAAIERLATDVPLRERLGTAARRLVENEHESTLVARQYRSVYSEAIAARTT